MKLEDGKGKNGDMSVSATQRGNVSAKIAPRIFYSARDDGLAYSAIYDDITATAGDYVAYIKNTSSTRNMYIGDISLGGVEAVKWKMFFCTGTAAAGEAVTATPMNNSKAIPAEAACMAGDTAITGLTVTSQFSNHRSSALATQEEHFDGSLILGPGDAVVIEYDAGTAGVCEVDIHFHYETIGAT